MNKPQEEYKRRLCAKVVSFTEIRTRTDINTTKGIKLVPVVVLRCPEYKRVVGPELPAKGQDDEI